MHAVCGSCWSDKKSSQVTSLYENIFILPDGKMYVKYIFTNTFRIYKENLC